MCKLSALNEMTQLELAYLAGIVDGEGSITISKWNRKDRPNEDYKLRLLVSNTKIKLIDWILKKTGLGSVTYIKKPPREKPVWRWQVSGPQAGEILKRVQPFLVIKDEHCTLAIEMRSLIERSKIERHIKWGCIEMSKSIRTRIRELRETILLLNKRGRGAESPAR